jgi:hypothetical protein
MVFKKTEKQNYIHIRYKREKDIDFELFKTEMSKISESKYKIQHNIIIDFMDSQHLKSEIGPIADLARKLEGLERICINICAEKSAKKELESSSYISNKKCVRIYENMAELIDGIQNEK